MKKVFLSVLLAATVSGCTVTAADLQDLFEKYNSAPAPTAPDITVGKGESGTSQIAPNDPDAADVHTYAITIEPTLGKATVTPTGLVTYTAGSDKLGSDLVEVTVTDVAGAVGKVALSVFVNDPDAPPGKRPQVADPMLAPFCGDGTDRALIKSISPQPGEVLPAGTQQWVANVAYAISNVPYDIHLNTYSGYISTVTITEPGCGTVTLRGEETIPGWSNTFNVRVYPYAGQELTYAFGYAEGELATVSWDEINYPLDEPVDGLNVTFDAVISYDLHGDTGDLYDAYFEAYADSSDLYSTVYWYPTVPKRTTPVTLRSVLDCGDTYVNFYIGGNGQSVVDWNESWITLLAIPPKITIENFYENIPVNGEDEVEQWIYVRACDETRDFTVTPSSPWMTVDTSEFSLGSGSGTSFAMRIYGAQLPNGLSEGSLLIQANDGSWSYEVPVSARKHNIDFGQYNRLWLTGGDDDASAIWLNNFPIRMEGNDYWEVYPSTNGTVAIGDYYDDYEAFDGPFNGGKGMPILALMFTDNGLFGAGDYDYYNPVEPDVYYREVYDEATDTGHLELLFWDQDSYDDVLTHNVIFVNLYNDGTSEVRFAQKQTYGPETFGWWHSDGTVFDQRDINTIRQGQLVRFNAVEY